MTSNGKLSLRSTIFFLALGLTLVPGRAAAQEGSPMAEGKFTLSSEVRWATTVLPAGMYSLSVDPVNSSTPFAIITISDGKRIVASFMSIGHWKETVPGSGVLNLVHSGDMPMVRSLDLPEVGVVYNFPVPKSARLLAEGSAMPKHGSRSIPGK
ncbi:MAG: hypothetical protein ACYDA9_15625 [Terriglobia bacterium]